MLDDGKYQFFDTKDYRTRLATHVARIQHENDIFSMYISHSHLKKNEYKINLKFS
jgi:hypothetical protein